MSGEPSTPLMRQYHALKQQVPNALLMFRLGDFYELFYDDAVTAARELEITLTSRNKEKGQAIPMCGVPYHASEGYIARLIQKGYRVAVCEQMEDPRFTKKLVRRDIARIITPGTATEVVPAQDAARTTTSPRCTSNGARAGRGARRPLDGRVPRHRDGPRRSAGGAREPERARGPAGRQAPISAPTA